MKVKRFHLMEPQLRQGGRLCLMEPPLRKETFEWLCLMEPPHQDLKSLTSWHHGFSSG